MSVLGGMETDRLIEQRNPGFVPALLDEQEGRIGAGRDHGGRQDLGGIVKTHGLRLSDLHMDLKRGRGGFEHDVEMGRTQVFPALDIDGQRIALAQSQDLFIEGAETGESGHVFERQVFGKYGRQVADHGHLGIELVRGRDTIRPGGFEFVVKFGKGLAGQRLRGAVDFDIETCKLGYNDVIGQPFQKGLVDRRRPMISVHQPGLELEAYPGRRVVEPVVMKPSLKESGFVVKTAAEGLEVLTGKPAVRHLFTHAGYATGLSESGQPSVVK